MPKLNPSLLELAIEAARMAPSADNSQPWHIRLRDQMLSVHHRPSGGEDLFGSSGHATLLGIGAMAENLSQIFPNPQQAINIVDLELGAPYFTLAVPLQDSVASKADFALFLRHTNRFHYTKTPPDAELLEKISQQREPLAQTQLLFTPKDRRTFSDITEICCKARFCNRDLHEWLMGSLRFSENEIKQGDGLAINTINLPPGGNLFMQWIRPWKRMAALNKLGAFKFMAKTEASLLRSAPLIVLITGENSPRGAFSAGMLMERTWILLNQLGWAAHPYYVVTDQESRLQTGKIPKDWTHPVKQAIDEARALINLKEGERIHMALRVGKPTKSPPLSLRRPVDQVLLTDGNT